MGLFDSTQYRALTDAEEVRLQLAHVAAVILPQLLRGHEALPRRRDGYGT